MVSNQLLLDSAGDSGAAVLVVRSTVPKELIGFVENSTLKA